MKWLKRVAIVTGLLLVILAAGPFFLSLNDYIPQIEKEVSEKLREPVKIKNLSAAALPLPHLTIDGITVGKAGELTVGKVRVTPDMRSLFSPVKVISTIRIDSLLLTQKAIDKIPGWIKPQGAQPSQPQVVVRSLILEDAMVKLDKASFGLIDVSAKSWKLPTGPAMLFDELTIKGVATLNDANLSQVNARLNGGTVNGKASVGWRKGLQLKGSFDTSARSSSSRWCRRWRPANA